MKNNLDKTPNSSNKSTSARKTFKWGDQEYLLDDLLKLHTKYENSYYLFAKERGAYDEEALILLRSAIKDRILAVKDGKSFDGDGVLDSDEVNNISIKLKGLFRKNKYVKQDITEWAKHYLNKLMLQMKPYDKNKKDTNDGKSTNSETTQSNQLILNNTNQLQNLTDESVSQAQKAWEEEKNRRYNIYNNLQDKRSGQMTQYIGKDRNFEATDEDLKYYLENTYLNGKTLKLYLDDLDTAYRNNPYNAAIAQIILPLKGREGLLRDISEGDYAGWSYDPSTIDETRQSVLAFNKSTGEFQEIFIGHAIDAWQELKNKYLRNINSLTQTATEFKQQGGILYFQTGGDFSSYDLLSKYQDAKTEEKASKTGNTKEVQKARDRIVSNGDRSFKSEDPSLASPDAGFTAAEYTRLGTIAADITSMFLDPLSGAAVGATSSLANFGADIADDGFQMKDVGNLLVNLGFDAVGLIPVVGDALGTGSKIVKQCIKLAPKVLTGLAAIQGVANIGGMTDSWKKLMSGDKDQKLTVQDWRNIAQSIGLLTGTVRGIKAHRSAKKMKLQAKVEDTISVTVENKKTGKKEQILVAGDLATQIKKAENAIEVNKILDGIEQYKGKFGENGELTVATKMGGLQIPFGKTVKDGKKSWGWKGFTGESRAKVDDVYDFTRVLQLNGWGWRPFGLPDAVRTRIALKIGGTDAEAIAKARQLSALQQPNTPENKLMLYDLKVVNKYIEYMTGAMESRNTKRKTAAEDIRSARAKVKLALDYEKQSTKLQNDLDGIDATIQSLTTLRNDKLKQLTNFKHRLSRVKKRKLTKEIQDLNKQISDLNNLKTLVQDALLTHLNNPQDLTAANKILDASIKKGQALSKNNHTTAYRRLLDYLNRLNNLPNTPLEAVKYDMKVILENAGIKNAFKLGGNINIYKLNEFLNYAKG